MAVWCPATCGACPACPCQDSPSYADRCPGWKPYCSSQVESSRTWVTTRCPNTCNACTCCKDRQAANPCLEKWELYSLLATLLYSRHYWQPRTCPRTARPGPRRATAPGPTKHGCSTTAGPAAPVVSASVVECAACLEQWQGRTDPPGRLAARHHVTTAPTASLHLVLASAVNRPP